MTSSGEILARFHKFKRKKIGFFPDDVFLSLFNNVITKNKFIAEHTAEIRSFKTSALMRLNFYQLAIARKSIYFSWFLSNLLPVHLPIYKYIRLFLHFGLNSFLRCKGKIFATHFINTLRLLLFNIFCASEVRKRSCMDLRLYIVRMVQQNLQFFVKKKLCLKSPGVVASYLIPLNIQTTS